MATGLFITGTDTGIGKTYVSTLLINYFIARGERVIGMKPIASGAQSINGRLHNDDAVTLMQASNVSADYELVNPYCFAAAIAPHIAAQQTQTTISLDRIAQCYTALQAQSDRVIVEGVGGWQVPINAQQSVGDIALQLQLPVIMVVGIKLGCLNHALLTAQVIQAQGGHLFGWIANQIDPDMAAFAENISSLETRLNMPLLARIPFAKSASSESFITVQSQFNRCKF